MLGGPEGMETFLSTIPARSSLAKLPFPVPLEQLA